MFQQELREVAGQGLWEGVERCPICGGADTCPLNEGVIAAKEAKFKNHIHYFWPNVCTKDPPCRGWRSVDEVSPKELRGPKEYIPEPPPLGWTLYYCGSTQAQRMYAHFKVRGFWVKQTTYVFYVKWKKHLSPHQRRIKEWRSDPSMW